MPGMRVILFVEEGCEPCQEARDAMKDFVEKNEVEVMDIYQGLKQFDLGDPEGVPFMAVISPSSGDVINKIYFQDTAIKEIKPVDKAQ